MSKHKIVPDVSLFEKLGARSRAFPMVTTELVDNSLDSWLLMPESLKKNKNLKIDITARTAKGSWFIIRDNAGGMTESELAAALTVAKSSKDKTKVLGSFGFGLKSAAMYIGPRFKIFTRSHKDPKKVYYLYFDKTKFGKADKWEIDIDALTLNEAAKADVHFGDGHGTEIWIENERFKSALEKGIVNRLRKTFAPRLPVKDQVQTGKYHASSSMDLVFNGKPLYAFGPFYEKWVKPTLPVDEKGKGGQDFPALDIRHKTVEIPEIKINGKSVWGRAGIIDRGMGHNNQYGFDLIKHFRVVELHAMDKKDEKRIGFAGGNHYARVVGQLFLDGWNTDHQKTEFMTDDDDWEKVTDHVAKYVKELNKISSDLQHPNKGKENAASKLAESKAREDAPDINKGVQRAVRSGSLKKVLVAIESRREAEKKKTSGVVQPVAKPAPVISNSKLLATKPVTDFERVGLKARLVKTKVITDASGTRLKVSINLDHPFLKGRESAELKAIAEFVAVDSFSQYILENRNLMTHEDFLELRDKFLTELRGTD